MDDLSIREIHQRYGEDMGIDFFLVTETRFQSSYLVTRWLETFTNIRGFQGVIAREYPLSERKLALREHFHQEHAGMKHLNTTSVEHLREIYPDLSETEEAMIHLFGIPTHSATAFSETLFPGLNFNSLPTKEWLKGICSQSTIPFMFIFIDQILEPWWIEYTGSRIINGHPAVLPYARGMNAIENIAISKNIEAFQRAAGGTVHYIDKGIDTGPIICAERFANPFQFNSIWEHKAYACSLVFDMLIKTAQHILASANYTIPVGTSTNPRLRGPNFNRDSFSVEARKQAEQGYLQMKNEAAMTEQRAMKL